MKLLIILFIVFAAGCSNSDPSQTSISNSLIGTWNTTWVTCNGSSITSQYVPSGGLLYKFTATNLIQTKSTAICSQDTTLTYTYDGTSIVVAAGSSYTIVCTPALCTDTGLVGSSSCGTTGSNSSTATLTVTAINNAAGGTLTAQQIDAQGSSICTSYGGVIPLTFSMTKQ